MQLVKVSSMTLQTRCIQIGRPESGRPAFRILTVHLNLWMGTLQSLQPRFKHIKSHQITNLGGLP